MTEKEQLLNAIQTDVSKLVENKLQATEAQIKDLSGKVEALKNYDDSELKAEVVRMSALVEALKEAKTEKKEVPSIREQLIENKEKLRAIKAGDRNAGFSMVMKAANDMSLSGNVTGQVPQAQRIPGLNYVPNRQVRFLDVLTQATASSNLLEWVYQANEDGTAGATSEGTAKKQIDFDMLVGSQRVEKYTALIRVTDEMLDDVDFISNAINFQLNRKLLQSVEAAAYSGDGNTPNLNGIRTVASAFSAGSLAATTDNANELDVLNAALVQIELADQNAPNYIFMNPVDLYIMKSTKVSSSDRRYVEQLNEVATQGTLGGIPIISTRLVTSGQYLVGDFTRAFLYTKQGVAVEMGYNADDFAKNFKTIRAEWRGATLVQNNDRTAFVKGVFATDKAALETT